MWTAGWKSLKNWYVSDPFPQINQSNSLDIGRALVINDRMFFYLQLSLFSLLDQDVRGFVKLKKFQKSEKNSEVGGCVGDCSLFRRPIVPKVRCSEGSMFRRSVVPKVRCSGGSMFRRFVTPKLRFIVPKTRFNIPRKNEFTWKIIVFLWF